MQRARAPRHSVLPDLLKPLPLPPVRFEERTFRNREGLQLTLDIYRPGYEHPPLPGVIVVHGGDWQSGGNAEFVALNAYLAGRDYVVAAINYRFAAKWPFPDGRDDVLAAIVYLKVVRAAVWAGSHASRPGRPIFRCAARAARCVHGE